VHSGPAHHALSTRPLCRTHACTARSSYTQVYAAGGVDPRSRVVRVIAAQQGGGETQLREAARLAAAAAGGAAGAARLPPPPVDALAIAPYFTVSSDLVGWPVGWWLVEVQCTGSVRRMLLSCLAHCCLGRRSQRSAAGSRRMRETTQTKQMRVSERKPCIQLQSSVCD
jgi:hypothetical protein